MAYYKTTVTYHNVNGLAKDDVVNTYHFATDEGPAPTVATGHLINGRLAANINSANVGGFYLESFMSSEISRVNKPTLRSYDALLGGSPLAVDTQLAMEAAVSAQALPSEVACVLSLTGYEDDAPEFAPDDADADSNIERPKSRQRGRIFFGPLNINAMTGAPARPSVNFRNSLINLGQKLIAFGDTPLSNGVVARASVFSHAEPGLPGLMRAIDNGWVDDAFDTQRRRGVAATGRTALA